MCVDGCLCIVFRGIWSLLVGLLVTLVLLEDWPKFALFSVSFEVRGTEIDGDRHVVHFLGVVVAPVTATYQYRTYRTPYIIQFI